MGIVNRASDGDLAVPGLLLALAAVVPAHVAGAQATTERASVSATAAQGQGDSDQPAISGDGRFTAFRSAATNLVPGDTNGHADVFVRDRWTGEIERVSVSSSGAAADGPSQHPALSGDGRWVAFASDANNLSSEVQSLSSTTEIYLHDRATHATRIVTLASWGTSPANGDSYNPRLSSDGRFVTFESSATNLVSGQTTSGIQVFRRDMVTGTTVLVSVATGGTSGNGFSTDAEVSADGRYVAFVSLASNLVSGDTNGQRDCFWRDLSAGITRRVSVSSSGAQASGANWPGCGLSADGRWVAFSNSASNLAPGEFAGSYDIFLHDVQTSQTTRISVNSAGEPGNGPSFYPTVSADGRYVAFQSDCPNLDPLDTDAVDDVFVRDRIAGTTTLVSRSSTEPGNDASDRARISASGALVVLQSTSSNLVPQDTNARTDVFVRDLATANHAGFCAGLVTTCPCGNAGSGGPGCQNSSGTGGALLRATGQARVADDRVTLVATGLPSATSAYFYQGTARENGGAGLAFGDGLRCAGGSLIRLAQAGVVTGVAAIGWGGTEGIPGGTTAAVHTLGLVPGSGGLRTYQVWYRNAAPYCTAAGFNLTNGVEIQWTP